METDGVYHSTPAAAVASANLDELCAAKGRYRPGRQQLAQPQALAAQSIAPRNGRRVEDLVFEQDLLIRELRVAEQNLDAIQIKEELILRASREGRILRSILGIGINAASAILAAVGNVNNISTAGALKAYLG